MLSVISYIDFIGSINQELFCHRLILGNRKPKNQVSPSARGRSHESPAAMDPPSRDPSSKSQANLFQVYLRLRPPPVRSTDPDRFLLVEEPEGDYAPTHITLNPPSDRRRAIEKFAFTRVFEEDATQLDLFHGTKVLPLVEGVLAPHGGDGTDGLLATLGVTGSGKVLFLTRCHHIVPVR